MSSTTILRCDRCGETIVSWEGKAIPETHQQWISLVELMASRFVEGRIVSEPAGLHQWDLCPRCWGIIHAALRSGRPEIVSR